VLDPAVSHIHAFIRFEGDRYVLYDLGSTGGTYVDEQPVGMAGVPLLGGEMIRIGGTVFEFGRVAKDGPSDPVDLFLIM
jgi:pSer/pThr/pTyr-binding forkhead associated (FHA) protein